MPDELPDALVAPVNCALAQVVYGLHQIRIWLGDTVVVQGAGGLGLYCVAVARDMGAGKIVAIDGVPERLDLARAFGADITIDIRDVADQAERVRLVREATGGHGADVCVEVAGVPGVVQEGLEMLRIGGRYLWMGNIVPGAAARIVPHDATRQPTAHALPLDDMFDVRASKVTALPPDRALTISSPRTASSKPLDARPFPRA